MCVFVGEIERVSDTKIFASLGRDGRQRLVYAMDLAATRDVAMILPLPVADAAAKDALRFLDLSAYPDFFDDLGELFHVLALGAGGDGETDFVAASLPVERVGDFEASWVPSHDDWDRLDPRFRLDAALWEQLGDYDDSGFAVFQLAADVTRRGPRRIHPMAFEFASRRRGDLFFPTVHVHDGRVHPTAEFDHDLYCQVAAGHPLLASSDDGLIAVEQDGWIHSWGPAGERVDPTRAAGLVEPDAPVLRRRMQGTFPNRDVVVEGR